MPQWTYKILAVNMIVPQDANTNATKIYHLNEDGQDVIGYRQVGYGAPNRQLEAHPDYQGLANAKQEILLPDMLNYLGRQGWEIVGIDVKWRYDTHAQHIIYLKKPLE